MTTPNNTVAGLAEKWRKEADDAEGSAREANSIGLNDAARACGKWAKLSREHADELEAALNIERFGAPHSEARKAAIDALASPAPSATVGASVDCPKCGAPALKTEEEGAYDMRDVYTYAPPTAPDCTPKLPPMIGTLADLKDYEKTAVEAYGRACARVGRDAALQHPAAPSKPFVGVVCPECDAEFVASAAPSVEEQPNPLARYWMNRSEFWMQKAISLGWREVRDAANGEGPSVSPSVAGDAGELPELRNMVRAMATKVHVIDRLARVDSIIEYVRRLATAEQPVDVRAAQDAAIAKVAAEMDADSVTEARGVDWDAPELSTKNERGKRKMLDALNALSANGVSRG